MIEVCPTLRPLTSSSFVGRYFSTQGTSKSTVLEDIDSFDARKSLEGCGDGSRLVRSSLQSSSSTLSAQTRSAGVPFGFWRFRVGVTVEICDSEKKTSTPEESTSTNRAGRRGYG